MNTEMNVNLGQLIADLDSAIVQAVENPLLFVNSDLLHDLCLTCNRLMDPNDDNPVRRQNSSVDVAASAKNKRETLLWQIRARAGRLQMLLDTAARFYSNCFSIDEAEGLAYGVHGEWSATATPSHLAVDC
jgi:hypothetical protein